MTITHPPYYRLNRTVHAVPGVFDRHADNEVIASFRAPLEPKLEAFHSSYDALEARRSEAQTTLVQSKAATQELLRAKQSLVGRVARDVPGFDLRDDSPSDTPLDVISDAGRVVRVMREEGKDLPYAAVTLATIEPRIEAASTAYTAAENARVALQEQQAETRARAVELQRELTQLRRALRAQLGSSHADYQRLRVARSRKVGEDEEVDGRREPALASPASEQATPPSNGRTVP
jgi:hypothetical protein